jgi:glycosyltransferase involved in cell wall biosynthesis
MHIVLQTQYYRPEIGAPQARLSALAQGLAQRGFRVTVLTAMPNYPRGVIQKGYGGWIKIEDDSDVRVLRLWIYSTKSASIIPRMLNYFSFVLLSFFFGIFYLDAPDVIFTESPPLFLGISGYLLSRIKHARWIFNVSDLWPESAVRLGVVRNSWVVKLSYWLEAFCYRKAWRVSGQSHEILASVEARFPTVKTYHLSNGADTKFFKPDVRCTLREQGVIALYAGLHGLAQGLDILLKAASQLRDLPNLKIILIGDGPLKNELIVQANKLQLDNVRFLEPIPHKEMPGILASADFCIVPLGVKLPGAVPSKLYEVMSSGKAVLLMAHGEAAEIVKRHDCGLVVSPGDLSGLVTALRKLVMDAPLRERLGANGRCAAELHFDHLCIVSDFANFLTTTI